MSRAAVFGTGTWGTAFALVLADAGTEVAMWGRRRELCEAINRSRRNTDYLPDIELPGAVRATPDPAEAASGADLVVLAVPSQPIPPRRPQGRTWWCLPSRPRPFARTWPPGGPSCLRTPFWSA